MDTVFDTWGEYNRECTSYVAWMLHSVNGFEMPFHDNASGWVADATALGYTVNTTPAPGAVAWMSIGHVEWVEGVNSNGTVNTEDYNNPAYSGAYAEHLNQSPTTFQKYIHFKDLSGGSGSVTNVHTVSLQGNDGQLWTYDVSTGHIGSTGYGLASGTSPAITSLSTGGYEVAFNSGVGYLDLWNSSTGVTGVGYGLASGTSPAITPQGSGGYEVAFQNTLGTLDLWNYSSGITGLSLGLASGTSPSIAGDLVAFQANTGMLWVYNISTGTASNLGYGMASGTSPSVAALSDGSYEVAFQNSLGTLDLWNSSTGVTGVGYGLASGTSPAITALNGGGYEVAFNSGVGYLDLWNYSSGVTGVGYGVAANTSPSIGALSATGGFEVAFVNSLGTLDLWNYSSGITGLSYGLASNTGPSIG
jgi:surface antigen